VCVCVRERERERERGHTKTCFRGLRHSLCPWLCGDLTPDAPEEHLPHLSEQDGSG